MESDNSSLSVYDNDAHGNPGVFLGEFTSWIQWDGDTARIRPWHPLQTLLGNGYGDRQFHLIIEKAGVRLNRCMVDSQGGPGDMMNLSHFGIVPWP